MVVDEENRKRRAEEGEEGEADEEEIPVPTEKIDPPQKVLTLEDIMSTLNRGMTQNQNNFDRLDRRVSAMQAEVNETKDIAAKATTIANDTRQQMTALERRVANLEKGGGRGSMGGQTAPQQSPNQSKRDWEHLGGEEGNTLVVGGFRDFAQKEERKEEWAKVRAQIPEKLANQIAEEIVPNAPCSTVLLKLHTLGGPAETRRAMLDWVRDFKALKIQETTEGESQERTFWAGPSKPYEMRQRDAKLTHLFEGIKILAGPEKAAKLHIDRSNGRAFWDRTMLVQRDPTTGTPIPREEAMKRTFPDYTEKALEEKVGEAKAARETARRSP